MKIDWKRKLTSRKLWLAVAGFVMGLIRASALMRSILAASRA